MNSTVELVAYGVVMILCFMWFRMWMVPRALGIWEILKGIPDGIKDWWENR